MSGSPFGLSPRRDACHRGAGVKFPQQSRTASRRCRPRSLQGCPPPFLSPECATSDPAVALTNTDCRPTCPGCGACDRPQIKAYQADAHRATRDRTTSRRCGSSMRSASSRRRRGWSSSSRASAFVVLCATSGCQHPSARSRPGMCRWGSRRPVPGSATCRWGACAPGWSDAISGVGAGVRATRRTLGSRGTSCRASAWTTSTAPPTRST